MQAAVLKTAWNGWGTSRRFQGAGAHQTTCLLGCQLRARDSIEHYDHCRTVRALHEEMGGTKAERRLPLWLGTATAHRRQDDCNTNDAKSAYATFITTNAARRKGGITADEAGTIFRDAFQQVGDDTGKGCQRKNRKRGTRETEVARGANQEGADRTCKRRRIHSLGPTGPTGTN